MEKKYTIIIIVATIALITLSSTLFSVDQREQVLVLQFGEPVRVIKEPGLNAKIPLLQNYISFDNRILDVGIKEREVIASDQKRIIINAFTKYRIVDALKFYTTVRDIYGIEGRLARILDSSLRRVVGEFKVSQLLAENRGKVMSKIKEDLSKEAGIFGIEVIDVRIMRADLPKENSDAIFARMQTEREKEAREIRANGAEEAQKVKAQAEKERTLILAKAKKDSEIMKGAGDAEASKIYAKSFGRDPEFAEFYQTMNAYQEVFQNGDKTKVVISPKSEFFKYFNKSGGGL